jgi:hypothetical protein
MEQAGMNNTLFGLSTSAGWEKVIKMSPVMKARDGAWDRGLLDVMGHVDPLAKTLTIGGHTFTAREAKEIVFSWIKMNDRAAVGVVWLGSYNKFMSENMDISNEEERHKKAVIFADTIVQDTQPMSLPISLSKAQKAEGITRFMTVFMTWTIKAGNRVRLQTKKWKDGEMSNVEYARFAMYEMFMAPAAATVISSLWKDGEFPEWWEIALSWPGFLMSFHPISREVWSLGVYFKPGGNPLTAMEGPARAVKAGRSLGDAIFDEGLDEGGWLKFLWDVGKLAEFMLRVPALTFVEDVTRAMKSNFGEKALDE